MVYGLLVREKCKLSKTLASGDVVGKEQDNIVESQLLLGSLCWDWCNVGSFRPGKYPLPGAVCGKNVLLCSFLRMRQKKAYSVLLCCVRGVDCLRVKSLCCSTVCEAQVLFIGFFFSDQERKIQEILTFQKYSKEEFNHWQTEIPGFPVGDGDHSLTFLTVYFNGLNYQLGFCTL